MGILLSALFAVVLLSACTTGWGRFDRFMGSDAPQQTVQDQKQVGMTQPVPRQQSQAYPQPRAVNTSPYYKPSPYAMPAHIPLSPVNPSLTVDNAQNAQMAMAGQSVPPPPQREAAPAYGNGKIQVALLLPLSGKHAALGQAMLNAAQLAVFDIAPSNFELMPRDTGGNADGAAKAAREAIAAGARLLIGPLFAQDVVAVKPVVQTSGVNMLALSTDVSLSEPGVYVMGFAPSPQVERVVAYAAERGARRFAALIPKGAYGALVYRAFQDAVKKNGGTIVFSGTPEQADEAAAKKDQIDTLFLPLGGEALRQTAAKLEEIGFGSTRMRLLGTGLWDEPDLGNSSRILLGGWYAASEPDVREKFIRDYEKTYGKEPPRLATLTYDATALAAVLAAREGRFDRVALTNPMGFSGLDGIFRLTQDGQAERGLAVNEITPNGNKVIDPSPSTFSMGNELPSY